MVKNNLTKDLLMFTDELYEPDSQRSYIPFPVKFTFMNQNLSNAVWLHMNMVFKCLLVMENSGQIPSP